MQQLFHALFITTFVYCASLGAMENNLIHTNAQQLPKEIIAQIAGYCQPRQKNILMRLCKDFCACLKDRTLILKANPSTVRTSDKIKEMFKYTYENNIDMMSFLLQHGAKATWKNILGISLFHIASDNNSEKAMQLLVKHGTNVNILKPQIHALHEAAYKGDENTVKILLNLKVNPNLVLTDGKTPLMITSIEGYSNIVESLLYFGAQVDHTDNKKGTALMYAANNGHTNIAELLLYAGANVNHADSNGSTPLHTASQKNYTKTVKLLIDNKAQVNHTNNNRCSALHFACDHGHVNAATLLLNANAEVNCVNNQGWTPLCAASYKGCAEIVKLLLDNGADMNKAIDADSTIDPIIKKGDEPWQIAQKKGHIKVIALFQEHIQKEPKKTDGKESCSIQ